MSKGNPIVGLAYVVTSQQEMLEKAQKENEELTKEYMELLTEKEALERKTFKCERGEIHLHEVEETLGVYEQRIKELVEECNDIKVECDAKVEELEAENDARAEDMNRVTEELRDAEVQKEHSLEECKRLHEENMELTEKIRAYEQGRLLYWQKFHPDENGRMLLPWGNKHVYPIVDGFYRYKDEHSTIFQDEVTHKTIPVKNCYGIGYVPCTIVDEKLYIYPNSENGVELLGFTIRYIDDYIVMDELPKELREE